jgi:hypothetical protein
MYSINRDSSFTSLDCTRPESSIAAHLSTAMISGSCRGGGRPITVRWELPEAVPLRLHEDLAVRTPNVPSFLVINQGKGYADNECNRSSAWPRAA